MKTNGVWIVALALQAALLGSPAPACAQDWTTGVEQLAAQFEAGLPEGRQLKLAVADFPDRNGVVSDLGRFLAERLSLRLGKNPKVIGVQRRYLGLVLAQLGLTRSDLSTPENARVLARSTGMDLLVLGTVTDRGDQLALDARLVQIAGNQTLSIAAATIAKDSKMAHMLEIGRE